MRGSFMILRQKKYLWVLFLSVFGLFFHLSGAKADNQKCPGSDTPPPPLLKVDMAQLTSALELLKDTRGRNVWKSTDENKKALQGIFENTKTKLEQFFQLMYLIQQGIDSKDLPMEVTPPAITQVLLSAKVFTDPSF